MNNFKYIVRKQFPNTVYCMILLMAFWKWQNYKDGKEISDY